LKKMKKKKSFRKYNFDSNPSLKAVTYGLMVSYMVTLVFFLLFALLLTYTSFSDRYIPIFTLAITYVGVFLAGFFSAKSIGTKGWLHGSVAGFLYIFVMFLLSYVFIPGFSISTVYFVKAIIGLLLGAVGGILGINFR